MYTNEIPRWLRSAGLLLCVLVVLMIAQNWGSALRLSIEPFVPQGVACFRVQSM